MKQLIVSGSPHVQGVKSVNNIMWHVIISMIPIIGFSYYYFGIHAIKLIFISVAACLAFEYLIQKFLIKGKSTIKDGSAVITGILLAFNIPSNLPWWILILGALVAIGIGKMSFGGIGKNPFNPALVGRVFLLISFPVQMTSWVKPIESFFSVTDAISGPTPLSMIKEGLAKGDKLPQLMESVPGYWDMFIGSTGGSLGEVSALALIIGALYMFFKKIITWHIPVAYILSVIIFSGMMWLYNPEIYLNPIYHILSGGMILGIFYMATDMVTSPMSPKGMILFGIGCGVISIIIRTFGAYPDGTSFAILIMNAFVPLINTYMKPIRFGENS